MAIQATVLSIMATTYSAGAGAAVGAGRTGVGSGSWDCRGLPGKVALGGLPKLGMEKVHLHTEVFDLATRLLDLQALLAVEGHMALTPTLCIC